MDSRGPQTENINVAGNEAFRPVYETASFTTAWDIIWHLNDLFTFENNLVYADFSYDRYTNPNSRGDFNTDGKEFHIEPLLRYIALDGSVNALIGRVTTNLHKMICTLMRPVHIRWMVALKPNLFLRKSLMR